jgi:nitroimidazol reductase NimA-like FMN-containing flavoprotein (pyridoxamine 5'-phosphate oxidase superfamily)
MPQSPHTPIRRHEKAITRHEDLEAILHSAQVCRLAMTNQETPYVVPMNYGYQDKTLYFHCAGSGRKLDIIHDNPLVCFELDIQYEITNTGIPCRWSTRYESVIGYGNATIIDDTQQKKQALNIIIDHYSPGIIYPFTDKQIKDVTIIKVDISTMTGKRSEPSPKNETR